MKNELSLMTIHLSLMINELSLMTIHLSLMTNSAFLQERLSIIMPFFTDGSKRTLSLNTDSMHDDGQLKIQPNEVISCIFIPAQKSVS